MPSRSILPALFTAGALLSIAGCPVDEPPEIRIVDMGSPDAAPDGGGPALQDGAQAWLTFAQERGLTAFRWVARCVPDECWLEDDGWRTSLLFEPLEDGIPTPDEHLGAERYVLFEWTGDVAELPAAAATLSTSPLDLAEQELFPPRVYSQATEAEIRRADALRWRRLGGIPEASARLESDSPLVRIEVLDTVGAQFTIDDLRRAEPADLANGGINLHGMALALGIHTATCGEDAGPNCPVEVRTRLALDLRSTGPEEDGGGFQWGPESGDYGDPAGVARAVWDATSAWSGLPGANRPALVLLLALGWNPPEEASPASEAAQLALDHARCFGAMPVIAYGNGDSPTTGEGPLWPAAFGDATDCARFGTPDARPSYTVAGLDQDRASGAWQPLVNARPWGGILPDAFAWGDGLRIGDGGGRWTGSSVAAALFAATLARHLVVQAVDREVAGAVIGGPPADELAPRGHAQPCRIEWDEGACPPRLPDPIQDPGEVEPAATPAAGTGCGPSGDAPCPTVGLLERADPQPDTPLCDVCSLTDIGAATPGFVFVAKQGGYPAQDELLQSVYLRVTVAGGDVLIAKPNPPFDASLTRQAYGTATKTTLNFGQSAAPNLADVKSVAVVGQLDHYKYKTPYTTIESGTVDP